MKPFNVAPFRSTERSPKQLAARELGHGLVTRSPRELAGIRRDLAEAREGTVDDYDRGFLDALEHVLSGLSAEVKHRTAVADDVGAARLRRNASKVLVALHAGHSLPSEIAAASGLTAPAVSSELAELERAKLVERAPRDPAHDQRFSPRALSVRGMQAAQALAQSEVTPTAEAARELAPVFVAFLNQLNDESCLVRTRLEEIAIQRLGEASGRFACAQFMLHAERQQAICQSDSLIALTTQLYRRRLRDLLENALSSDGDALLGHVRHLSGLGALCLRATTSLRDLWQVVFDRHRITNAFAWCRDDARADQLPAPSGPYLILWENPEIMTRDLDDQRLASYIARADRRLCYVATDLTLPSVVERIDLDARLVGR